MHRHPLIYALDIIKVQNKLQYVPTPFKGYREVQSQSTPMAIAYRSIHTVIHCDRVSRRVYLGSGGPSDRVFMESLQRERNTKKASFWRIWENLATGEEPRVAPDS
jgi:hypothetical protein